MENKNMNFEFKTRKGLKAELEVREAPQLDGRLIVDKFIVDNKIVFDKSTDKRKLGDVILEYATEKATDKRLFSMQITDESLMRFLKISNMKVNVKRSCHAHVEIPNKDLENLYNELPKIREKEKITLAEKYYNENKNTKISCFKYSDRLVISNDNLKYYPGIEHLKKLVGKYGDEELKPFITEIDWGDYTVTTYYSLTINELERIYEICKMKDFENIKRQEERKRKKAEKRQAIFDKAKETGEKQLLEQFSMPCDDENEQCNIDIVCIYALPNGDIEEVKNHTW